MYSASMALPLEKGCIPIFMLYIIVSVTQWNIIVYLGNHCLCVANSHQPKQSCCMTERSNLICTCSLAEWLSFPPTD